MDVSEIKRLLENKFDTVEDEIYGKGYRASVYLTDGTFLPCVLFRNPNKYVSLAIRRFKEEKKENGLFSKNSDMGYVSIVKNFVAEGNQVNAYDIKKIESSVFALPQRIRSTLESETSMGWTGFVIRMMDDKLFGFGTSFNIEFFEMPEGYTGRDVNEIVNHSYVSKSGELRSYRSPNVKGSENTDRDQVYREKPFFVSYVDGL